MADWVGLALLVVLDTLTPAERLAFVLHDTFEIPFEEIAPILGRSPARPASSPAAPAAGCRGGRGPRRRPAASEVVVDAFLAAARTATSTPCSPCSTRTWCSAPSTRAPPR